MDQLIKKFTNDPLVISLKHYLEQEDLLQIIGKERKEIPYTKFLEWLFDTSHNQNLGVVPVRFFLKMFPQIDYWHKVISCTATENMRGDNGYVDLWLDCKLDDGTSRYVCIENKVLSNTENNQLERYYNEFNAENVTFCVLAPEPDKLKEQHCKYHKISYQNFMDNVLVPLINTYNNSNLNQIIHAMECPLTSEQEPMAISAPRASQIEKLMGEYKDFMIKVLKMSHEKNLAEIRDMLNIMGQDNTPGGKGYYLYLIDPMSNERNSNVIGPFASVNMEMLRALATLYIKSHDIIDEKAFTDSSLSKVKMGDVLIFSLDKINTSYNNNALELQGEKYKDINQKIYIYSQIRTPNQQDKVIEAIKSLGFIVVINQ